MMLDWALPRHELLARVGDLSALSADTTKGLHALSGADARMQQFGARIRGLTALACAATLRCD